MSPGAAPPPRGVGAATPGCGGNGSSSGNYCRPGQGMACRRFLPRVGGRDSIRRMRIFVAFVLSLYAAIACSAPSPAAIRIVVEDFLRIQTRGLPGQVTVSAGAVDAGALPPCPALEAELPPGGRAWGRTTVIVRCRGGEEDPAWKLYVQAQVRVTGSYLVATRPLPQGQALADGDVRLQPGDLTEMPPSVVTDPAQALGRTLAMPVAAGGVIRSDLLRQPQLVQAGQSVKVVSGDATFQVANEGQALNGAAAGQLVRVRLSNGQVVSGIAKAAGLVQVAY